MFIHKNQKGFSVAHALVFLLVLGIIGFAGWRVYEARKEDSETDKTQRSEPHEEESDENHAYTAPEGYVVYENEDLGFSFAYPETYGDITAQPDVNETKILASADPGDKYGPGIVGSFRIFTYQKADQEIVGRKYGPKVQLQQGKWIVTETNEADIVGNKVGDEYLDFDRQTPQEQDNNGLAVYLFKSGDEGQENDRLVFVTNNQLHELYLPVFSDGLYGDTQGTAQANDKTKFNELIKSVMDSVRAYE